MNANELTAGELRALQEALGELPPSDSPDPQSQELRNDFNLFDAGLRPVPPMPPEIAARLKASADDLWESRYGKKQATAPQPIRKPVPQRRALPGWMLAAAAVVLLGTVASVFLATRSDASNPTFVWENSADKDQLYDVWVLPAEGDAEKAPALFKAENVRSPVKLAAMQPGKGSTAPRLEKDKPHRILVCLASVGKFGGDAVPFTPDKTVQASTPTAPAVLKRLIDAGRMEDARKVLAALPEAVRDEPQVLELAKQVPP